MADIIDAAQELADQHLAQALKNRKRTARPMARGYCLNPACSDDLHADGQLFCDAACAAEYEKYGRR